MKKTLKTLITSIMTALMLSAVGTTEIAYALNGTSSDETASLTEVSDETKVINTADEALPFNEKPDGNYFGNSLLVIFKYDFTKEYVETVIKPELDKLAGKEQISRFSLLLNAVCDDMATRLMYGIYFNFDDKERIYNTAVDFYNTGYFYSVEMNHIPIPAEDDSELKPNETEYSDVNNDSELIPDGTEYGDVNNDGIVNISDIVALNLYLLNKEKYPLSEDGIANADCLKDNVIDARDATLIMNYIAEIIEKSSLGKVI